MTTTRDVSVSMVLNTLVGAFRGDYWPKLFGEPQYPFGIAADDMQTLLQRLDLEPKNYQEKGNATLRKLIKDISSKFEPEKTQPESKKPLEDKNYDGLRSKILFAKQIISDFEEKERIIEAFKMGKMPYPLALLELNKWPFGLDEQQLMDLVGPLNLSWLEFSGAGNFVDLKNMLVSAVAKCEERYPTIFEEQKAVTVLIQSEELSALRKKTPGKREKEKTEYFAQHSIGR